ncbi:MAG: hypothetical protein MJ171_04120, partial [Clostridia bacterium]|nr:hypothetical protein [Clostridia bacterium]
MKYIVSEKLNDASGFTAYAKARMDVEDVLTSEGFLPLVVTYTKANLKSFKERTKRQFDAYKTWKNALKGLGKGDSLVIQYPEDNNCQLLGFLFNSLKRKGVKIVALVHDIDLLRFGNPGYGKVKWMLYRYLEVQKINSFSKLILHNEKMKETAVRECSLPEEKIVPLGIFDYVLDKSILEEKTGFDRS